MTNLRGVHCRIFGAVRGAGRSGREVKGGGGFLGGGGGDGGGGETEGGGGEGCELVMPGGYEAWDACGRAGLV